MPGSETPRRLKGGRWIRWDEERARAAYESGYWVRETIADAAERAARDTPDRVLLVDGEARIDCRTLFNQASAIAGTLSLRLPPRAVVSFMLPNWHEAASIYLGATLSGMVAHPILPSLRNRELAFMLKDVDSRVIFIPAELRGHDFRIMLERVCAQIADPPEIVVLRGEPGNHAPFTSFLDQGNVGAATKPDPDEVRMVLYTSGTTGTPKGALHTHNSIHANIRQIGQHWPIEPGDSWLVPSPVSHISGAICAFEFPLLLGTSAVLMDQWNADEAIRIATAERCTHIMGATPFLEQLLDAARRARTSLPHLKLFVCGGSSVPPSLIRSAAAHFERAIVTRVYGSTEVPTTTIGAPGRDQIADAAETDGRPGIAEVKLVPGGQSAGCEGEIWVRGAQMLVGYLHPEDEAGVFDETGYYRTGDLGRWTESGCLIVSGRAKDIIIRNGENISPKEVEDALIEHPDIAEIAIVGVPDATTGERACAVIVPANKPGPDVASLRSFLRELGMAAFKVPEEVVIWDALPRNDAGKIVKERIRSELARPRA